MNRILVLHHLAEAHETLGRILEEARQRPDWGVEELFAEMPHLYHHINTAWNARDATNAVEQSSDAEFRRWSAFPTDLPMFE